MVEINKECAQTLTIVHQCVRLSWLLIIINTKIDGRAANFSFCASPMEGNKSLAIFSLFLFYNQFDPFLFDCA